MRGDDCSKWRGGFSNKSGIPSRETLANPKVIKSASTSPPKPLQGWATIVRSSGGVSHDQQRVTEEKITRLKQVFSESLVILEDRLSTNRE